MHLLLCLRCQVIVVADQPNVVLSCITPKPEISSQLQVLHMLYIFVALTGLNAAGCLLSEASSQATLSLDAPGALIKDLMRRHPAVRWVEI